MKRLMQDKRGSVAIVVMLSMVSLLGMGAIVIDGGQLYFEKARLQTAVDASALAGVQSLRYGASVAHQAALDTARANGLEPDEVVITIDPTNRRVHARAQRQVTFGLARVLGSSESSVQASSEAGVFSLSGFRGAVPLGVLWQDFVFGQVYTLKEGAGDGHTGNYGALALGTTGASNYEGNLRKGYNGWLHVGNVLPTEPGNMSGPTKRAIEDRIRSCAHGCTFDNYVATCERVVIVPIIGGYPNGRGEVNIVGFAGFYIEDYIGTGNDNYIKGRFIELHASGQIGAANDYGVQVVRLTR